MPAGGLAAGAALEEDDEEACTKGKRPAEGLVAGAALAEDDEEACT